EDPTEPEYALLAFDVEAGGAYSVGHLGARRPTGGLAERRRARVGEPGRRRHAHVDESDQRPAAGAEHAAELAQGGIGVWKPVEGLGGDDGVESSVPERQPGGVALEPTHGARAGLGLLEHAG